MLYTSQIISEGRGSVGGLTFSRNRYGLYTRTRAVPVNPNSTRQTAVRAIFAALAGGWTGVLTQAQRDAWDLYGANVTWLNKLGQPVTLTGYSHFQRSNGAILAVPGTAVLDGPTTFSLPGADETFDATISEATQLISVVFDTALDWVGEDDAYLLVHMAQPRSGSRTFIGGPTRTAGSIDGDATTPPTSPQTIAVPFAVAAGQKTEVLARIIRADGRTSNLFRTSVTVAA